MSKKAVASWNKVVKLLMRLGEAWEKHQEILMTPLDLSQVPTKGQELLTLSINRARFGNALPDFYRIAIVRGGFEELLIPQEEEEEKDKND